MRIIGLIAMILFMSVVALYAEEAQKGGIAESQRLIQSGEYEKAKEILKRLVSVEPKNAKAHKLLGGCAEQVRQA